MFVNYISRSKSNCASGLKKECPIRLIPLKEKMRATSPTHGVPVHCVYRSQLVPFRHFWPIKQQRARAQVIEGVQVDPELESLRVPEAYMANEGRQKQKEL